MQVWVCVELKVSESNWKWSFKPFTFSDQPSYAVQKYLLNLPILSVKHRVFGVFTKCQRIFYSCRNPYSVLHCDWQPKRWYTANALWTAEFIVSKLKAQWVERLKKSCSLTLTMIRQPDLLLSFVHSFKHFPHINLYQHQTIILLGNKSKFKMDFGLPPK